MKIVVKVLSALLRHLGQETHPIGTVAGLEARVEEQERINGVLLVENLNFRRDMVANARTIARRRVKR